MPDPGKQTLIRLYYQEKKRLQEIGDDYGVSRERVRQWMERYDLPRSKRGKYKRNKAPKYESLKEYFQDIKEGGKESTKWLVKFISPSKCLECDSIKNLHIHHKKYPALSLDDLQILCASCHFCKHRKGNGHKIQLEICDKYIKGQSGIELAKKYDCNSSLIYHILHRWNIEVRPKGRKKQCPSYNVVV